MPRLAAERRNSLVSLARLRALFIRRIVQKGAWRVSSVHVVFANLDRCVFSFVQPPNYTRYEINFSFS